MYNIFATTIYYEVEHSGYVQIIFWPHSCFLAIGTSVPESHICTRKKKKNHNTNNPKKTCFTTALLFHSCFTVLPWFQCKLTEQRCLFQHSHCQHLSEMSAFLVRKKKSADYASKRRERRVKHILPKWKTISGFTGWFFVTSKDLKYFTTSLYSLVKAWFPISAL